MARFAVCLEYNLQVANVIIAEDGDLAPLGTLLIPLPDDSPVSQGWLFDGIDFTPQPEEG